MEGRGTPRTGQIICKLGQLASYCWKKLRRSESLRFNTIWGVWSVVRVTCGTFWSDRDVGFKPAVVWTRFAACGSEGWMFSSWNDAECSLVNCLRLLVIMRSCKPCEKTDLMKLTQRGPPANPRFIAIYSNSSLASGFSRSLNGLSLSAFRRVCIWFLSSLLLYAVDLIVWPAAEVCILVEQTWSTERSLGIATRDPSRPSASSNSSNDPKSLSFQTAPQLQRTASLQSYHSTLENHPESILKPADLDRLHHSFEISR